MRLPTRMIREWKTVASTDGEEIVWIAVLDDGEFALCVDLPERQEKPLQDLEEVGLPFGPEPGDLTVDEQGRSADERYQQERQQMRTLHERRGAQ